MSHQPKSFSNNANPSKLRREETLNKSNCDCTTDNLTKKATYFEKKYNEGYYTEGNSFVLTFGSNEMGQLGHEAEMNNPFSYNPIILNSLTQNKIISISAGDGHSVCVSQEGAVYAWGASACGQLGLDDNETMPRDSEGYPFQPTPIPVQLISGAKIREVACGDAHTLAMTVEGRVFSWGGAGCGQLGHSNINEMPKDADNCPYQPFPRLIETLKSLNMIHIACGKAHSLAIDSAGCLFTWGAGACGQLGVDDIHTLPVDDDGYPYQPVPKHLKSLKGQNIILGVCGDVHTLVLNDKGEVYSFGGGSFGQLGLGPINKMPLDSDRYPYMPIPTKIEALSGDIQIISIACGDSHSMAVDSEGKLYGWGAAACGQLGFESLSFLPKDGEGNPYQPDPKIVSFFENMKILSVSCGEAHTLALVDGGVVYSFGGSTCGQLGYPEVKDIKQSSKSIPKSLQSKVNEMIASKYDKPRLITSLLGKNIYKLACGGVHNLVLAENQTIITNNLYKMFKNDCMTDIEIFLDSKTSKNSLKCHKFVLISRSNFFKMKLMPTNKTENSDKLSLLINISFHTFKSVIEYLYLDDISFINNIEYLTGSITKLDILLEILKLAKLFELKTLQTEIECKIRLSLSKYSEALNSINSIQNELEEGEDKHNLNITDSQFKGLFFLPNGDCMLLIDEDLVKKVRNSSIMLNFQNSSFTINNTTQCKSSSQKNYQENQNNIKGVNKYTKSSFRGKEVNTNITSTSMVVEQDEDCNNLSNLINVNASINKTINQTSTFSYASLSDSLMNEFCEVYEVLLKFNLIDVASDFPSSSLDLLKFFNKAEGSDIVIKVENKIFYGHKVVININFNIKAILACSSKYFEMMFSENMKENSNGEIVISEYNADEFIYLMLFFYCDSIVLDFEKSLELLKGADMFAIDSLKYRLENYLSSKLEIENAAKVYKFASFYNYERLKKICLAFILDNYKFVIETQEFEDLHRESMLEIIRFCKSR